MPRAVAIAAVLAVQGE
jgi:cell division protein FtsZ